MPPSSSSTIQSPKTFDDSAPLNGSAPTEGTITTTQCSQDSARCKTRYRSSRERVHKGMVLNLTKCKSPGKVGQILRMEHRNGRHEARDRPCCLASPFAPSFYKPTCANPKVANDHTVLEKFCDAPLPLQLTTGTNWPLCTSRRTRWSLRGSPQHMPYLTSTDFVNSSQRHCKTSAAL